MLPTNLTENPLWLWIVALVLILFGALAGCSSAKTQEDLALQREALRGNIELAQELGVEADGFLLVDVPGSVGAKTEFFGPVKAIGVMTFRVRPGDVSEKHLVGQMTTGK